MRVGITSRAHAVLLWPAVLLLCIAGGLARGNLLSDVPMNKDAGCGNLVFLTIGLADGERLPCILDTGAPITCLDESLEPELGQRVRTDVLWIFGKKSSVNVYTAPALYWGATRLIKTGPYITTHDWKSLSARLGCPVKGVIGMDILENYCVQLDFRAHRIRFLDPDSAPQGDWGKSFPMSSLEDGCPCIAENLAGRPGPGSLIDTGFDSGGWLVPDLYDEWANRNAALPDAVFSPDVTLGGEVYRGVRLTKLDAHLQDTADTHIRLNGIGIEFLALNLVTLDFPEQTLYVKREVRSGLASGLLKAAEDDEGASALVFLKSLEQDGRLPGWSKGAKVAHDKVVFHFDYPDQATFDIPNEGDSSTYHYEVSRDSRQSPWKLVKAWRTGPDGRTIENYTVR